MRLLQKFHFLATRGPDHLLVNSASELAWRALCIFEVGISLRSRGKCIGNIPERSVSFAGSRLIVNADLTRVSADPRARTLRQHRHRHDPGCRALGAPRAGVIRLLTQWDRAGAVCLLAEALEDAIAEIDCVSTHAEVGWLPTPAWEVVNYAVRKRVTPSPFPIREQARG